MNISDIDFPKPLLNSVRSGDLIIFAGAGVSMGAPASLPDFRALTKAVAQGTGETLKCGEPEDRFLGRLKYQGVEVHQRAADLLSGDSIQPNSLHLDLLKLFSTPEKVRLVTTNFDSLFSKAAEQAFGKKPETFNAPALPLAGDFAGLVHLHGTVDNPSGMILTDEDFGKAYFIDGWARRFAVELLGSSTVLFVGYSYNDVVMHYLTRALPKDIDTDLFALTDDAGNSRWGMLGIFPIAYPREPGDDHIDLTNGVEGLTRYARRRILDWRREIADIAKNSPSLDEEAMDLVDDALSDPTRARFFTEAAEHPDWIAWLERRGHLDHLVGTEDSAFTEVDGRLSTWLADKFALDHTDDLFSLLARRGMLIHPRFWSDLGISVAREREHPPKPEVLEQWVSALLATKPVFRDSTILPLLGQRCRQANLTDSTLDIFVEMASSKLVLNPGIEIPGYSTMLRVRVETTSSYSYNRVNELWQSGLKPKLNEVAETLLGYIVQNLTEQHRTLIPWHSADREEDIISQSRWSIDSEQTYVQVKPVDVLIDAVRDCLAHLAENRSSVAATWCDMLIRSDIPILRRLSMHTLSHREDLTSDMKADWILEQVGLYDLAARRETYRAIETIYPETSEGTRIALVDAVLEYTWPEEGGQDREWLAARDQFNWLSLFQRVDPDCQLARETVSQLCEQYPELEDLEGRDDPHLSIFSGPILMAGNESPWSVAELLSQSPCEWADSLLTFCEEGPFGASREGLLNTVREAAIQNFDWGLGLADKLSESDNWDADLWSPLIEAWTRELDEDSHRAALGYLSTPELFPKHPHAMAEFLLAIVKDEGWAYASKLLGPAIQIAGSLWTVLDRDARGTVTNDWMIESMNHPAGSLVLFWLHGLSLTRRQQDVDPDTAAEFQEALSLIVQDDTIIGKLGKTILASQLPFLVAADETWTTNNLLPLFGATDNDDYRPVWHGFIRSNLNPRVAELLSDAFLESIPQVNSIFPDEEGDLRRRFVSRCTTMIFYFVEDPLDSWIPELFSNEEMDNRLQFAWDVARLLEETEDSDQNTCWNQWLNRYWTSRLQGVPKVLEAREIDSMLDWLKYFDSVYPEAVEHAIRMLPATLEYTSLIHDLSESDLWSKHPEVTSKLLIKLAECKLPPWMWEKGGILIESLLGQDISQDLKTGLVELRVSLGFD